MFHIGGGHDSGDAAGDEQCGDELDHFFLVLVAAQDKQGRGGGFCSAAHTTLYVYT